MSESVDAQLVLSIVAAIASILVIACAVTIYALTYQKKIYKEQIKKQQHEIEHQKKMLKAAFEAQENEMRRVAKELHDNIGMMLMTLRINLNDQPDGPIQELRMLVDETHETIKKISWDLMPTTLDNFGLFQTIQEMCLRRSAKVRVAIACHEVGRPQSLDKDQELLVYRIVQEAVNNALRHAHPAHVEVSLQWNEKSLALCVKDDGVGFDFPATNNKIDGRHGLGLYNLENRVNLLNATLSFSKNNPTGSIVSIYIPLSAHEPY